MYFLVLYSRSVFILEYSWMFLDMLIMVYFLFWENQDEEEKII